jgi:hypothetical protein
MGIALLERDGVWWEWFIRGMVFGGSGLIRGLAFGGSGFIRGETTVHVSFYVYSCCMFNGNLCPLCSGNLMFVIHCILCFLS